MGDGCETKETLDMKMHDSQSQSTKTSFQEGLDTDDVRRSNESHNNAKEDLLALSETIKRLQLEHAATQTTNTVLTKRITELEHVTPMIAKQEKEFAKLKQQFAKLRLDNEVLQKSKDSATRERTETEVQLKQHGAKLEKQQQQITKLQQQLEKSLKENARLQNSETTAQNRREAVERENVGIQKALDLEVEKRNNAEAESAKNKDCIKLLKHNLQSANEKLETQCKKQETAERANAGIQKALDSEVKRRKKAEAGSAKHEESIKLLQQNLQTANKKLKTQCEEQEAAERENPDIQKALDVEIKMRNKVEAENAKHKESMNSLKETLQPAKEKPKTQSEKQEVAENTLASPTAENDSPRHFPWYVTMPILTVYGACIYSIIETGLTC
jgi:chromosome segregation ATPase